MSKQTSFGRRVAQLRRRAGLSQNALAEKAGLSRNYIGLLETGGRSPSLATALRIREALDADWNLLVPDAAQGSVLAESRASRSVKNIEDGLPDSRDYVRLLRRLRRCSDDEITLIERIVRSTLKMRSVSSKVD